MRTAPLVDQVTYDKVIRSLARARYRGASPVEQLNRDGLLWTPDRERQTRIRAMRYILDEMNGWSPAEFLRRRKKGLESATPTDMYICINEWLKEHVTHAQLWSP